MGDFVLFSREDCALNDAASRISADADLCGEKDDQRFE
jgi:hypothetical protein